MIVAVEVKYTYEAQFEVVLFLLAFDLLTQLLISSF